MDNELYDSLEDDFSSASSTSINEISTSFNEELKLNLAESLNSTEDLESCFTSNTIWETNDYEQPSTIKKKFKTRIPCYRPYKSPNQPNRNEGGDISSMVPLYDGEKQKSEISRKSSNVMLDLKQKESKDDNQIFNFKPRSKFTKSNAGSVSSLPKSEPTKSYLSLFHARIGYPDPEKKEINDTIRSLYGDSERSLLTEQSTDKEEFQDAECYESDTASLYFQQIEEFNRKSTQFPATAPFSDNSISVSNFQSLSELFNKQNNIDEESSKKKKNNTPKTKFFPVPALGGLGPENALETKEKLERRKKQLTYGQKVSYRNRIKMVEIKVLKNLKQEIHESNSLDIIK